MAFNPLQPYGTISDTRPQLVVQGGVIYNPATGAVVTNIAPYVFTSSAPTQGPGTGLLSPANISGVSSKFSPFYAPLTLSAIGDSLIDRCTGLDLNAGNSYPSAATIATAYADNTHKCHTMSSFLLHAHLRANYAWTLFEFTAGCGGATSDAVCVGANNPNGVGISSLSAYLNNPYGLSDMCLVLAGTNDTTNGNFTPALTLANLKVAYSLLLAAGVLPVAATLPPNSFSPLYIQRVNAGIQRLAQEFNIPCADFYSAVAGGSTGDWAQASYHASAGDVIHPSPLGAGIMGYALYQALNGWVRAQNRLVSTVADVGVIGTYSLTAGGSSYGAGPYYNVPLTTSGAGTGAKGSFLITGGVVIQFAVTVGGTGYAVNDTLGVNNSNTGGTGSGFVATINSLNTAQNLDPNILNFAGTINTSSSYPNQWDTPVAPAMSTIINPLTGSEFGSGKTPYRVSPTILQGNGTPNYIGNAWQLKGNGTNPYNGGSYNVTTATGDKMLLRFRVKWLPDLTQATLGDFRLAFWDGLGGSTGMSGIAAQSAFSSNLTCPIGGEPGYDAGDFMQIFTVKNAGGGKFVNFLRADFANTSSITGAPNATDWLTTGNIELLNLTQLGLVTI